MCCVYYTLKVNKNYIIFVLKKKKEKNEREEKRREVKLYIAIRKDLISFFEVRIILILN